VKSWPLGGSAARRALAFLRRDQRLDPTWWRIAHALCPGGLAVQSGPFAGMRYLPFAGGSGLLPKLAGSYECELHPAIAESIARAPARLLNIGAAEGYYAIGYALRLPAIEVVAFDVDRRARRRLRRLARANGVHRRIRQRRACTAAQIEELIVPRTLVVCDCEGCETALLDPRQAPGLLGADLLVEVHIERRAAAGEEITERFAGSHACQRLDMIDRQPESCSPEQRAVLARLAPEDRSMALFERNERTGWLWLRSRRGTAPGAAEAAS
jgi:hypothetical protein